MGGDSAQKSNVLPRFGESNNSATKGGYTYFTTDNTDQNIKSNANDLLFYDVNQKKDISKDIKNNVFSVNTTIQDTIKVDPTDSSNTSEYNHLENAINLAMCGAWEDSNDSLCRSPWGSKTSSDDNIINYSKVPDVFRNSTDISDVVSSLDNFSSDNNGAGNNLTTSTTTVSGTVDKQQYYNGMFYMINKYLLAKSRFYNSANTTSSWKPGVEQLIELFTSSSTSSGTKICLFVVLLLSLYLIFKGLSTITNTVRKEKLTNKSLVGFVVVWIVVVIVTVLTKYTNIKNYYSLFTGDSVKLNEPCKNSVGDKLSKIKFFMSIASVILLIGYLKFDEYLRKKNSNKGGYYIFGFIMLIGFSSLISWFTTPSLFNTNYTSQFKMSYDVDDINELPFRNTSSESTINVWFWVVIFIILILVSLGGALSKLFKKDVSQYIEPWLRLRGMFIIAFNLILIYYIPYYLLAYPIVCMIQRLSIGSFILPGLLNKIPNIKYETMPSSQKLVLFNLFVGWDLPGWSFIKIIDVLEKLITGKVNFDEMLSPEANGQNTANINVFTEFSKSQFLSPLISFFYTLIPPLYYKKLCKYESKGLKLGFMVAGLFLAMWLGKIILNYFIDGDFDLSYPFTDYKKKASKISIWTYISIYIITGVAIYMQKVPKSWLCDNDNTKTGANNRINRNSNQENNQESRE